MPNETSADVGADLARYIKATGAAGGDRERYADLVDRMLSASCTNAVDALALVSWVGALLPTALARIPDDDPELEPVRFILEECTAIIWQAVEGLTKETGVPVEAFIGAQGPAN